MLPYWTAGAGRKNVPEVGPCRKAWGAGFSCFWGVWPLGSRALRSASSVGAHPVRDRRGNRHVEVAHWVRSYRERTRSSALAFDLPSPMPRAGGRGNSPKGGRQGRRPVDRQGRMPCRSTPPPGCDPAGTRHRGGLSLGYFSLARQREVTRAAAAVRKPAAGEPSSGVATRNRGSGFRFAPQRRTWRPARKAAAHRVRSYSDA